MNEMLGQVQNTTAVMTKYTKVLGQKYWDTSSLINSCFKKSLPIKRVGLTPY